MERGLPDYASAELGALKLGYQRMFPQEANVERTFAEAAGENAALFNLNTYLAAGCPQKVGFQCRHPVPASWVQHLKWALQLRWPRTFGWLKPIFHDELRRHEAEYFATVCPHLPLPEGARLNRWHVQFLAGKGPAPENVMLLRQLVGKLRGPAMPTNVRENLASRIEAMFDEDGGW